MKQTIVILVIIGALFASCGTSKKLKAANEQNAALNSQVDALKKQAAEDQNSISQLKTENIQYGKEAEDCRKAKEAIARREENLNKALAERGTSMKLIQHKAADALRAFEEQGATVTYQKGFVHIEIPDKLAFPSGSTKVSHEGRQVMSVVADVLTDNPHVSAIIIGNTDSIAITKTYKDNWSLSTERANAMVRVLRDTYKVDPSRLTAAGKGKYNPLGDNATEAGRAMNRRIEVILNPDLTELWKLSEDAQ